MPARIAFVTDAWRPQINGVVRVLKTVLGQLAARGHAAHVIQPENFTTIPCPTYPEIPLALFAGRRMAALLDELILPH
jgi:hypothetical protein